MTLVPWKLTQKAGDQTGRDFDKHLVGNWTVTTKASKPRPSQTNPFLWSVIETAIGTTPVTSKSLEMSFDGDWSSGWSMYGPTSGRDQISTFDAARKLGENFKNFETCLSIIRIDIRDSLHTAGKYDCGRSFLDTVQARMEDQDSPFVKSWVVAQQKLVASCRNPESKVWPKRWLEAWLHIVKEMFDSNLGAYRWNTGEGTFNAPLILDGPMGMRYEFNFPPGISPRLSQICDFMAMNGSKFKQSQLMFALRDGKRADPQMDPYLWTKYSNLKYRIYCYEIFRIVQCDQNDLLMVPCLYDMGIGDQDVLGNLQQAGSWSSGPMKERGGPFRYNGGLLSARSFQKEFRIRHNLHRTIPGIGGHTLLRLSRSMVQKQYTGRGIVDKNNEPKFGDYIMLARGQEMGGTCELKTVPGLDGISEIIFTKQIAEGEASEFFHITMSQAAMGNKRRTNPDNPSPYDHYAPNKYDGAPVPGGASHGAVNPSRDQWVFNSGESMTPWETSKAKKTVRPFEKMEPQELASFMVGMTTADAENHDISDGARVNDAGEKIIFVPTWKDSRKRATLNLTNGKDDYYSDIIRCGECNGRTLVMLPSGNELEACECPHCLASGGLNTAHLVEGNPMPTVNALRPNR